MSRNRSHSRNGRPVNYDRFKELEIVDEGENVENFIEPLSRRERLRPISRRANSRWGEEDELLDGSRSDLDLDSAPGSGVALDAADPMKKKANNAYIENAAEDGDDESTTKVVLPRTRSASRVRNFG
jgi:hypothetical protein